MTVWNVQVPYVDMEVDMEVREWPVGAGSTMSVPETTSGHQAARCEVPVPAEPSHLPKKLIFKHDFETI